MRTSRATAIRIFAVCLLVGTANLASARSAGTLVKNSAGASAHFGVGAISTADMGNSHGGGGFTELDPQADVAQISAAIKDSRLEVTAWFHSLRSDYEAYLLTALPSFEAVYYPNRAIPTNEVDPAKTLGRFFPDVGTDIIALMEQVQIEIANKGPCRDTNGNPVDGSFNPARPLNICISALLLAKKLKLSDYKAQTESLIVHELTHLLGGNEPEAVYVQTFALSDFMKASLTPIGGRFEDYKTKICPELIDISSWMTDATNTSEIHHLAQAFAIEMRALRDSLQAQKFDLMVVNRKLFDRVYQSAKLASILARYACSQDASLTADKRTACQKEYENGFGGEDTVELAHYFAGDRADGYEYITSIEISKIKSHDDWVAQLKGFKPLLQRVGESVDSLARKSFHTLNAP